MTVNYIYKGPDPKPITESFY